jgi:hypothetical protein
MKAVLAYDQQSQCRKTNSTFHKEVNEWLHKLECYDNIIYILLLSQGNGLNSK